MIARCRSKCWIIQLREENQDLVLATTQRGIKGHIIIYPQQPSKISDILPPSVEEITSPVCILFVSSSAPTPKWLRDHAKPLAVNASCVRTALQWLKTHNHLYRDIQINEECLSHLEQNPVLPFSIEHILPSAANEASTARYDSTPGPTSDSDPRSDEIAFQNVLRATAFRHVNKKDGGYIQIPHDRNAENEF
ncbi:hypothetical protein GGX14DRAFT_533656 [Mycena pura]|uniref:DUF6570 domain-containing protein n=1 Tax=Mycena pura TaxID=153505 RepID=A0AAD6YJ92_9AGAR|nr:hypothetical protein GGX14DRAFT_533656 [Mycena pura]